ncbi:DUF4241 domain-containing protein [Micromonospora sp. NPDC047753]|uniref:DUF4241 domain-containing protein n=1 Tax=Micromonospora sp. NPDC047753 TaxID=3154817 RepID=UPI0033C6FC4D
MLIDGARITHGDVEYVIKAHPAGTVTLPSGQVVGCDPLIAPDTAAPFTVTVTPGRYRLAAWVATIHQSGSGSQDRTAALQLVVRDRPTVRWELALTDGQEPVDLGADGFFGYPVDAGVGTLADVTSPNFWSSRTRRQKSDPTVAAALRPPRRHFLARSSAHSASLSRTMRASTRCARDHNQRRRPPGGLLSDVEHFPHVGPRVRSRRGDRHPGTGLISPAVGSSPEPVAGRPGGCDTDPGEDAAVGRPGAAPPTDGAYPIGPLLTTVLPADPTSRPDMYRESRHSGLV